ncbi:MAG: peptide ABC transporter substrate-binding protein [Flavobacteriia bacterium]|nr:peptide ABC transporter substrate-binding protein [Flavobacteriia bacterium]
MKYIVILFLGLILFTACDNGGKSTFEFAGGTFKMALNNEPSTYIPRETRDLYSSTVLSQVMEGLVSYNPKDLSIQPQIAKSWKISPDGLIYTFTIRDNIKFHPHSIFKSEHARILSVDDVEHTFELICKKNQEGQLSPAYYLAFDGNLKGVDDFIEGKSKKISGINVAGNTITIELKERDNNFLSKLASITCAITSKRICESSLDQDMIGTGPFKFQGYREINKNEIVLAKNDDYYLVDESGNQLPYLDNIVFTIESKKLEQLEMFEKHELDFIAGLPTSRITKMLEGKLNEFNSVPPSLILSNNPLLTTNYLFFNLTDDRFKDVKVRQAFNYALDREKLGRDILKNQYYELGYYGIVPPLYEEFRGYDFNSIKQNGYHFNPEKAKQLLAEAGYPNGKGFGTINLRFNMDEIQSSICDEVSIQIAQILGININIDGSTFDKKEKDADFAKSELFRSGWAADYPSPESFLSLFYGKTVPENTSFASRFNQSRYQNANFDKLFELGKKSTKVSNQMKYFSEAEKILIKDAPFIPLWYRGDYEIVYSNVRNFHLNPLNIYNFTYVYKKEWTKEEYEKSMKEKKNFN